jgi:hypothetical protein
MKFYYCKDKANYLFGLELANGIILSIFRDLLVSAFCLSSAEITKKINFSNFFEEYLHIMPIK